jgi:alpha-glucuronidase
MKKLLLPILFLCAPWGLRAEDDHQLWLRRHAAVPVTVVVPTKKSVLLTTAKQELQQGWQGLS